MLDQMTASAVSALKWRYATQAFDKTQKISASVWNELEKALVLSPSSFGLQPYKFIVITDQNIKDQLVSHSWNQKQPAQCSHMVVFARLDKMTKEYVEKYLELIVEVRKIPKESLKEYASMMHGFVSNTPEEKLNNWMEKQAYIALGNLMTVASMLQVDNCPMEGLVPAEYDRILGLPEKGLRTVVACALGYRSADDKYATFQKVRFPARELIINI